MNADLHPSRRQLLLAGAGWSIGVRAADDEQPVVETLPVPGGEIEVQFVPGFDEVLRERALRWVRTGAEAVAQYLGRFPVPQSELLLQPVDGDGVVSGVSFGVPSPLIRIRLGRDVSDAQLRDDWILTHEMVHLAVPQLALRQRWLHEGIATYVEALARGRAGLVDAAAVWQGWHRAMLQGQPAANDRGLDFTPTWGRTYWGGAMFCLLADVRMRRQGDASRGLRQALQGVLAAGGDYRVRWPTTRELAAADAAVGGKVLSELYEEMKDRPARVDLDALWRGLGVEADRLRDDAPWTAVRRAILA
jgi:hypothetical protein